MNLKILISIAFNIHLIGKYKLVLKHLSEGANSHLFLEDDDTGIICDIVVKVLD